MIIELHTQAHSILKPPIWGYFQNYFPVLTSNVSSLHFELVSLKLPLNLPKPKVWAKQECEFCIPLCPFSIFLSPSHSFQQVIRAITRTLFTGLALLKLMLQKFPFYSRIPALMRLYWYAADGSAEENGSSGGMSDIYLHILVYHH